MKKLLLIFGTRPEAVKMCPLINELRRRNEFTVSVCLTGQHRELISPVLGIFGITAEHDLAVMQGEQTLYSVTMQILTRIRPVLEAEKPGLVIVHGDTSTAFAAALAAYYMHIPVAHVEAGLRTYDAFSPYPEEFNRRAVDIISSIDFAPTDKARDTLLREGKTPERVFVTGNTVIDALKTTVRSDFTHPALKDGVKTVLMTAHRRESLGEPMRGMFRAVRRAIDENPDVQLICPVHPNPSVKNSAYEILGGHDRIYLTPPLELSDFHSLMSRSYLVLTDSGGIQEEAPYLGIPVLVIRDKTERPEGLRAGVSRLIGTKEDSVYRELTRLLRDDTAYNEMKQSTELYGDGRACERIADILIEKSGTMW